MVSLKANEKSKNIPRQIPKFSFKVARAQTCKRSWKTFNSKIMCLTNWP